MADVFKAQWALAVLLLLASLAAGAQDVHVSVDDTRVVSTTADHFHGTNLEALWNNTNDSPGTKTAYQQTGLGLLRFPGGVPCEFYDWEHPLDSGWSKLTPTAAYNMAALNGGSVIFQTNAWTDRTFVSQKTGLTCTFDSSGTNAAKWVTWAKDNGVKVAYWEIGNEPEVDAPASLKSLGQQAIYDVYNAKFLEQASAMKAADPSIKVIGPASANKAFWYGSNNLVKFLMKHGNRQGDGLVDAISLHWYGQIYDDTWEKRRGIPQSWAGWMGFIRAQIATYDTRILPVIVDEWSHGGGPVHWNSKLARALIDADTVGMFLRTGVAAQTSFDLQKVYSNWGILAMRGDLWPENTPSPTFFGLTMAAMLHGDVLATANDADEKNVLSAYATRHDGQIQVMLINKDAAPHTVGVAFTAYNPVGRTMQVYRLAGSDGTPYADTAVYNGVTIPHAPLTALPRPKPVVDTESSPVFVLAPYSMAVIVFQ